MTFNRYLLRLVSMLGDIWHVLKHSSDKVFDWQGKKGPLQAPPPGKGRAPGYDMPHRSGQVGYVLLGLGKLRLVL